jgi:hypothetical protein
LRFSNCFPYKNASFNTQVVGLKPRTILWAWINTGETKKQSVQSKNVNRQNRDWAKEAFGHTAIPSPYRGHGNVVSQSRHVHTGIASLALVLIQCSLCLVHNLCCSLLRSELRYAAT